MPLTSVLVARGAARLPTKEEPFPACSRAGVSWLWRFFLRPAPDHTITFLLAKFQFAHVLVCSTVPRYRMYILARGARRGCCCGPGVQSHARPGDEAGGRAAVRRSAQRKPVITLRRLQAAASL
jgi:hypothetical protein